METYDEIIRTILFWNPVVPGRGWLWNPQCVWREKMKEEERETVRERKRGRERQRDTERNGIKEENK